MNLYAKYRPVEWSEIVGQDKAVKKAQFIGRNGWEGESIWVQGKSGQGKSSMANIIASEHADNLNITETTGMESGQVIGKYKLLANDHKGNMRAMLQDIESGCFMDFALAG